jgi:chromosome segregation ATPase
VDSTADVRAAAEAERARLAAAARELQAKKDELASLAQVEGESADAATAEAEASRKALDRLLPVLTEAEAAFAAQNSRVEAELAKLEAMQAPLRELKQATAAAEAARDAADQRAIECGAMREKHLEKLKKYEAGEGQAGGDNGGAGKAK